MPVYGRNWIQWCRDPEEKGAGARVLAGRAMLRLNAAAAEVWEGIEGVDDRERIFRRMRRRWTGVTDRRLRDDLDRLLDEWEERGWIGWRKDPVFPFPEEPWPV